MFAIQAILHHTETQAYFLAFLPDLIIYSIFSL